MTFFRYLQLRQYLSKEILKNEISPEINEIIQLTTRAHAGTSKSIVSTLYRGIAEGVLIQHISRRDGRKN